MGYVSTQRTELSWFEILNRQLNNSVLCGRIESQLGNVCCQDEVALLLQAALLIMPGAQGQGGTVHTHGPVSQTPCTLTKGLFILKGGAGQLSGSSDAEGKGRGRNEKTFKAFSFQPLLRILNAFSFAFILSVQLTGQASGAVKSCVVACLCLVLSVLLALGAALNNTATIHCSSGWRGPRV